ncbi:MAG: prepilin-type N-terminal cleavage/methylation domain-containing protein [Candidatus Liptonbacteria bacterium]
MIAKRCGATLIEVLISIAVTAVLSSMVILYGGASRTQMNLYVETVKFSQVLLRAKSLAISLYGGSTLTCGYGVRIDQSGTYYSLFRYSLPEGDNIEKCRQVDALDTGSPYYVEVQKYNLSPEVTFDTAQGTIDEVLFVPPDPKTKLWNGASGVKESGNVVITAGENSNRMITVTTSGQVNY